MFHNANFSRSLGTVHSGTVMESQTEPSVIPRRSGSDKGHPHAGQIRPTATTASLGRSLTNTKTLTELTNWE